MSFHRYLLCVPANSHPVRITLFFPCRIHLQRHDDAGTPAKLDNKSMKIP